MKTKTNIALIGMMGTYKSSAGKILAQLMGKSFIDTDELVVALSGKTVPELFELGEEIFRKEERKAVSLAADGDNTVIACGGGVALFSENMAELKKNAIVVLLTATPQAIYERVGKASGRPLLDGENPEERIAQLLYSREPIYSEVADFVIDNTKLSSKETAQEIIKKTVAI